MHKVFKVDPSICGVKFLSSNQAELAAPETLLPLELFSAFPPLDHPLLEPEALLVMGQPPEEAAALDPSPGGALPAPDLPHKSCPICVRGEEEEEIPPLPQSLLESFDDTSGLAIPMLLQVELVRPKEATSATDELLLLDTFLFDRGPMGRGVGATEPGVRLGSSSGFLIPVPFHGLPGSNSGIPKSPPASPP